MRGDVANNSKENDMEKKADKYSPRSKQKKRRIIMNIGNSTTQVLL